MLVPSYSSSSSFYPLNNWLDTAGFSNLLATYSIYVLPIISISTLISFASNICLVFMLPLVYLGHMSWSNYSCLIYFWSCFFSHIFVSPDKFLRPATLAAFWARVPIPLLYINTPKATAHWEPESAIRLQVSRPRVRRHMWTIIQPFYE